MAIPAQQQSSTQAHNPRTNNHDPGDDDPRPFSDATVAVSPESTERNCASGEDEVEVAWRRPRRRRSRGGREHRRQSKRARTNRARTQAETHYGLREVADAHSATPAQIALALGHPPHPEGCDPGRIQRRADGSNAAADITLTASSTRPCRPPRPGFGPSTGPASPLRMARAGEVALRPLVEQLASDAVAAAEKGQPPSRTAITCPLAIGPRSPHDSALPVTCSAPGPRTPAASTAGSTT
jgi:hypothetical protein